MSLDRNDSVGLAAELIKSRGIRHFSILQSGRLIGVISQLMFTTRRWVRR